MTVVSRRFARRAHELVGGAGRRQVGLALHSDRQGTALAARIEK